MNEENDQHIRLLQYRAARVEQPPPVGGTGESIHDLLCVVLQNTATAEWEASKDEDLPPETVDEMLRRVSRIRGVQLDVQARKQLGLEQYGTVLQANNGRNAWLDAYQELLDAAAYIGQAIEEEPSEEPTEDMALLEEILTSTLTACLLLKSSGRVSAQDEGDG